MLSLEQLGDHWAAMNLRVLASFKLLVHTVVTPVKSALCLVSTHL